jgi:hypothetical protein
MIYWRSCKRGAFKSGGHKGVGRSWSSHGDSMRLISPGHGVDVIS